uniref:peptide chain release factor N(5)-glutamine methyltransferase n=1 Tax=Hydrogenophaga sp. TaxID=1904254 RepID=UPI003563EB8A
MPHTAHTPDTPTTLAQALQQASAAGLDRIDAQQLLLLALGRDTGARAWLLAHGDDPLPHDCASTWAGLTQRRLAGEPFAYILGQREFFGLTLQVDARVLVPRPDTETLVEWALEKLDTWPAEPAPRLLDLGTGSGAIALALKSQRPKAQVCATDASVGALAVAQANAQRLGLAVEFRPGHWLAAVPGQRFDLIAS